MANTVNLGSTKPVSESDSNKVAAYNQLVDDFDAAIAGMPEVNVAGGSNVTLTTVQGRNSVIKLIGTLTGNITVFIRVPTATPPNDGYSARLFLVWNATSGAFTVTIKTTATSSAGVVVTQAKKQLLFHNGTDVIAAAAEIS